VSTVRRPDEAGLAAAIDALRRGELVGLPTETVYGLAAVLEPGAIAGIFALKGRPADNPLIVHVADAAALRAEVGRMTPLAERLAAAFWPGPLTLVLPAGPKLPRVITGGLDTVAVRVPDHPVATALLRALGEPVAAPSANRSGRPSPTTAQHVADEFGDTVEVVLDGGASVVGLESTVVDARGDQPVVLREGAITREDLRAALAATATGEAAPAGTHEVLGTASDDVGTASVDVRASPGTRYRHYAPDCRVVLTPAVDLDVVIAGLRAEGVQLGVVAATSTSVPDGVRVVARFDDAGALAQQLYAALREAESAALDVLVVETVTEDGIGRAVMDRLRRAAAG
jgi:L-threonylcarbamoyladenylate synthase